MQFYYVPMLTGALELYADLLQRFPNNIHLLLEIAKVRLCSDLELVYYTLSTWQILRLVISLLFFELTV